MTRISSSSSNGRQHLSWMRSASTSEQSPTQQNTSYNVERTHTGMNDCAQWTQYDEIVIICAKNLSLQGQPAVVLYASVYCIYIYMCILIVLLLRTSYISTEVHIRMQCQRVDWQKCCDVREYILYYIFFAWIFPLFFVNARLFVFQSIFQQRKHSLGLHLLQPN